MRYIAKSNEPPPPIQDFLAIQLPVEVNLDYEHGFTRKPELLQWLIQEQFGLCAYTGLPIDEQRIADLNSDEAVQRGTEYRAHNEHIKAQSICRDELIAAGKEPSVDLGEDMDHRNIVAAIEVRGAAQEQFGAAARGNDPVALPPTNTRCEPEFQYHLDGRVTGASNDADETIGVLRLSHETLRRGRESTLAVFLDPVVVDSREGLREVVQAVENPQDGSLTKFSFCIASAAKALLQALDESED